MSNPEDHFLNMGESITMPGRDVSLTDNDSVIEEALDKIQPEIPRPKFQPKGKVAQEAAAKAEAQKVADPLVSEPLAMEDLVSDDQVTAARLKAMEQALKQLLAGQNGVKLKDVPKQQPALDFSKLSEKDVFDMNIPIEAIVMDIPEYVDVELADGNYIARWVNKHGRRLGQMKNFGFSYVTEQDLAKPLLLENSKNENGQFTLDDVILMKCSKQKYFGVLRRNLLRANSRVNPKEAHKVGKQLIENDLKGVSRADYDKYAGANQLNVYSPFEI